jgi:hypothetical protein
MSKKTVYAEPTLSCSTKIEQAYVCDVKRGTEAEKQYLKTNKEFREIFSTKNL